MPRIEMTSSESIRSDEEPSRFLDQATNCGDNYIEDNIVPSPESLLYPATSISLPWILKILFGLHGLSISLESLGLMYVVNTRVEIPLAYLPTYGAIAFLPNSLKPIYAYFSQGKTPRYQLYMALITANCLFLLVTCMIPKGAILLTFVVAFARGVTSSWAEFCLGLSLIDYAQIESQQTGSEFDFVASKYQAGAATCRNAGSFLATLMTCLMFLQRQIFSPDQTQLSGAVANTLLVVTALLQVSGAASAYFNRDSFQSQAAQSFTLLHSVDDELNGTIPDEESALKDDEGSHPSYSSQEDLSDTDSISSSVSVALDTTTNRYRANGLLVVLLQATVMVLALKGPISDAASHFAWKVILISLVLATGLLGLAICFFQWWLSSHRVGLYLILKHSLPSAPRVLGSFFYSIFQSAPLQLQLLSLGTMVGLTFSSWTYSTFLSKFSSGRGFLWVVAGTTLLLSFASLGNLLIYNHSSSHYVFWIALVLKVTHMFAEELEFLPNIVLATTSAVSDDNESNETGPLQTDSTSGAPHDKPTKNVAVKYGTLSSCIEFGDQIGALLTGPLVALLGVSRENGFAHLDQLILLTSLFSVLSIGLIPLLHK